MNDLIKREDSLNTLLRMDGTKIDKALAMGEIRSIPSVDRPQGWIPCSERLPKPYAEVLVCDDCGWISLGAYRPCDVSDDCSGWSIHTRTKIGTEEVIAWMPLPDPWKGASRCLTNSL